MARSLTGPDDAATSPDRGPVWRPDAPTTITITTSARATSDTWFDTAAEPTPSSRAATEEAWHSRVQ